MLLMRIILHAEPSMISALNIHVVGVFEYKWVPHVETTAEYMWKPARRATNTELAGQCCNGKSQTSKQVIGQFYTPSYVVFKNSKKKVLREPSQKKTGYF